MANQLHNNWFKLQNHKENLENSKNYLDDATIFLRLLNSLLIQFFISGKVYFPLNLAVGGEQLRYLFLTFLQL